MLYDMSSAAEKLCYDQHRAQVTDPTLSLKPLAQSGERKDVDSMHVVCMLLAYPPETHMDI